MGLLQVQIVKYLQITSKSKLLFLTVFFFFFLEISKVKITCEAYNIKLKFAR